MVCRDLVMMSARVGVMWRQTGPEVNVKCLMNEKESVVYRLRYFFYLSYVVSCALKENTTFIFVRTKIKKYIYEKKSSSIGLNHFHVSWGGLYQYRNISEIYYRFLYI